MLCLVFGALLPRRLKLYVLAQFVVTCTFSLYVFTIRDQHSLLFLLLSAAFIFVTLTSLGGLLDGRPKARWVESIRVGVGVSAVLVIAGAALVTPPANDSAAGLSPTPNRPMVSIAEGADASPVSWMRTGLGSGLGGFDIDPFVPVRRSP